MMEEFYNHIIETYPLIYLMSALLFFMIAYFLLKTISFWRIFKKADKDGWISIIPFYNLAVLLEIVGLSKKMIFLYWIPFNIVLYIKTRQLLAKNFGKSKPFAIGLILLPFVFLPILAFDNSKYHILHS